MFGQRRKSGSRSLLVASTLLVSIAVVSAVGFKLGGHFDGAPRGVPVSGNDLLAVNVDNQGNLADRAVGE